MSAAGFPIFYPSIGREGPSPSGLFEVRRLPDLVSDKEECQGSPPVQVAHELTFATQVFATVLVVGSQGSCQVFLKQDTVSNRRGLTLRSRRPVP